MERIVKYSRYGYAPPEENGEREEPLSTFLYDLPTSTDCNFVLPLHILNMVLLRGQMGSLSPEFTWQPFELSEQEYQETLPKLLDPNWAVLRKKIWCFRLPMKHAPEFDHLMDRYEWMLAVCEKYGIKSLKEAAEAEQQFRREHPGILENWRQR